MNLTFLPGERSVGFLAVFLLELRNNILVFDAGRLTEKEDSKIL